MRGGRSVSNVIRGITPARDAHPAATLQVPAPYDGWNARGNLTNMKPTEAIVMDNIFPGVQEVSLRAGMAAWKTGFAANVHSLLVYNGTTTTKMWAVTDAGFYDATAAGAVGAAVAACTNGYWETVNFATPGGSYALYANGVDNIKLYDGTVWETVTGVSAHAITGIATTSLMSPALHKSRVWFIEKNSMNLWYLPTGAIAGVATSFPIGSLFRRGGKVLAISNWTLDGGTGQDDYFVIITTRGEAAVYQGTDPASASTWSLIGIYDVGLPVGKKPLTSFGGDLLYLSQTGLFPMTKLLQSAILTRTSAFSYKIDGAFLDATTTYLNNTGWEMIVYRSGNFLLVNIPISNDAVSYQYVMNTITGAWCRFTNWNATCWALMGTELYFGGGTSVSHANVGTSDNGVAITGTCAQAYVALGSGSQKQISMIRPNFSIAGRASLSMALDSDFKTFSGQTQVSYTDGMASSLWDSAIWDTSLWPSGLIPVEPKWETIPGEPGFMHSFRMQLTTSEASFTWTSLNYAFQSIGIL